MNDMRDLVHEGSHERQLVLTRTLRVQACLNISSAPLSTKIAPPMKTKQAIPTLLDDANMDANKESMDEDCLPAAEEETACADTKAGGDPTSELCSQGRHPDAIQDQDPNIAREIEQLIDGVAGLLGDGEGERIKAEAAEADDAEHAAEAAAAAASTPEEPTGESLLHLHHVPTPDTASHTCRMGEVKTLVEEMMERLAKTGVPVVEASSNIKMGKVLGKGAFGTVRLAHVMLDESWQECAVKTIVAKGNKMEERLEAFETEAQVSWAAGAAGRAMKQASASRVCRTLAVGYTLVSVPRKPAKPAQHKPSSTPPHEAARAADVHAVPAAQDPKTTTTSSSSSSSAGAAMRTGKWGEDAEQGAGQEQGARHAEDALLAPLSPELLLASVACESSAHKVSAAEQDIQSGVVGAMEGGQDKEEEEEEEGVAGSEQVGWWVKVKVHLIMEKLQGRDLHKEVTAERWWEALRQDGEDTGKRLRGAYTMTDEDGDVFCYTMPRKMKLLLAEELALGMIELARSKLVHCDVKPSNILVVSAPNAPAARGRETLRLKIIDFGEGNTANKARGFVAGTPGYQALEVAEEGECSLASDMYSVGVSLIELWTGDVWQGAETRGEGYDGMRQEMLAALGKVDKADPKVARILRRCVSNKAERRPSARSLYKALRGLRLQARPLHTRIARDCRAWAALSHAR
jgi:serine/threonine protein kinase